MGKAAVDESGDSAVASATHFPQNTVKPAKSLRPSAYENMDLPRTPNGPSAYLRRTLRVFTQDLPRTA